MSTDKELHEGRNSNSTEIWASCIPIPRSSPHNLVQRTSPIYVYRSHFREKEEHHENILHNKKKPAAVDLIIQHLLLIEHRSHSTPPLNLLPILHYNSNGIRRLHNSHGGKLHQELILK